MLIEANPRRHSNAGDPRNDPVEALERPGDFRAFLSDDDFAQAGWHTRFGHARFFYLEGVSAALRLFQAESTAFLKEEGYIDKARAELHLAKDWGFQSGLNLTEPISIQRTRNIKILTPTHFQKCVVCIVAFELAIRARLPDISPFWVYDYMRVKPAVYSIRHFNIEKLELLRAGYANFDERAKTATNQDDLLVFDDLASGIPVTRPMAERLKLFLDENCRADESHYVENVRVLPGSEVESASTREAL